MFKETKILCVVSNHPPDTWTDEQKQGWDDFIYVPFPEILPQFTREEVEETAEMFANAIFSNLFYYCIQGEYLFTFLLSLKLVQKGISPDRFVYPVSERKEKEEVLPDGTVKKTQYFKFIKWR